MIRKVLISTQHNLRGHLAGVYVVSPRSSSDFAAVVATGTAGRTRTPDARLYRCILLRGAGGAHHQLKIIRSRRGLDPPRILPPAPWNLCSLAEERLPLEILHWHTGSRRCERRTRLFACAPLPCCRMRSALRRTTSRFCSAWQSC